MVEFRHRFYCKRLASEMVAELSFVVFNICVRRCEESERASSSKGPSPPSFADGHIGGRFAGAIPASWTGESFSWSWNDGKFGKHRNTQANGIQAPAQQDAQEDGKKGQTRNVGKEYERLFCCVCDLTDPAEKRKDLRDLAPESSESRWGGP